MKTIAPEDRAKALLERQQRKMARSAGRFVRGSTADFYRWLTTDKRQMPEGPPIWICGDCHYGNLGPVANAKGDVAIQIRDLDQTVIGNPAHDLTRLAFSLASAARGFDLSGVTTAHLVQEALDGYQDALTTHDAEDSEKPVLIKGALRASRHRGWRELARERLEDLKPTIPLGRRFWPLEAAERDALAELVQEPGVHDLVTSLHDRPSDAPVRFVDAAYWVKGCSSLGLKRYAILVQIETDERPTLALIDVKEATAPQAPSAPDAPMPTHNGERVLEGARQLAPFLGQRMRAARVLDTDVFVRELLPQDLKLEIELLDAKQAVPVARYLAAVVGQAHARQMDGATRAAWAEEIGRSRSGSVDAPSWLWKSVVELMGAHEAAYLDHCRRYAALAA